MDQVAQYELVVAAAYIMDITHEHGREHTDGGQASTTNPTASDDGGSGASVSEWDKLADELVLEIFTRLDDRTLVASVPGVCRRWRSVCRDTRSVCINMHSILYGGVAWHAGRRRANGGRAGATPERQRESQAALWVHRNDAMGPTLAAGIVRRFCYVVAVTMVDEMHENVAKAVIESCPRLRSFTGSNVCIECVAALTRYCPKLTSVAFPYSYNRLIDASVIVLAHGCPRLTSVNMRSCGSLTDVAVVALAKGCPLLTVVNLCQCDQVTDVGVLALAERCPLITEIDLSWCDLLTDAAVVALAKQCSRIKRVDFDFCYLLTDVGVIALAEHCEHCISRTPRTEPNTHHLSSLECHLHESSTVCFGKLACDAAAVALLALLARIVLHDHQLLIRSLYTSHFAVPCRHSIHPPTPTLLRPAQVPVCATLGLKCAGGRQM
jgi:hypothetical protein